MENFIEEKFTNEKLGFELTSFIDKQQNVWFRGKDVAKILGYCDTTQAIRKNVCMEDKYKGGVVTTGGLQTCVFINESGFYSLLLSSKLETAKKFKHWVTSQVLPSIRKYGYYKLFDSRIKQRVIIDSKKYYKHPVFTNYAASKNGDIISLKTKKIMSKIKQHSGYFSFNIYDVKLENPKTYYQHRFIYEVFRGSIPRFFQIDHINNCKKDNRLKNLVTYSNSKQTKIK